MAFFTPDSLLSLLSPTIPHPLNDAMGLNGKALVWAINGVCALRYVRPRAPR